MCRSRHRVIKEESDMTAQDDRPVSSGPATDQLSGPAPAPDRWPTGPGHAFPVTAPGVPLSAFAFAFAVGFLGLVDTGILTSAASGMFFAVALGIGTLGLLVGGLWEFRAGELFGGTFGVGYAGFLLSTGLILRFFAAPIVAAAGPAAFDHAFAAWLILWAIFTGIFAIGARTINMAAFTPFFLAFVVLVILAIALLGGTASWTASVTKIGGWVALADSAAAGYLATAILLNTTFGRDALPLWPTGPRA
jgi:succinate-acetate transporter protein